MANFTVGVGIIDKKESKCYSKILINVTMIYTQMNFITKNQSAAQDCLACYFLSNPRYLQALGKTQ
jgi:hypothetical protein